VGLDYLTQSDPDSVTLIWLGGDVHTQGADNHYGAHCKERFENSVVHKLPLPFEYDPYCEVGLDMTPQDTLVRKIANDEAGFD
jgi:hypothetical protein